MAPPRSASAQEWVCCDACEEWYTFESVGLFVAPVGAWYCDRHGSLERVPQTKQPTLSIAAFNSQGTNSSSSMSERSPSASEYPPPRPKCADVGEVTSPGYSHVSDENQHQASVRRPVVITPMPRIGKKRAGLGDEQNPLRPPSSRKKKERVKRDSDDSDDEAEEKEKGDDEEWRPR